MAGVTSRRIKYKVIKAANFFRNVVLQRMKRLSQIVVILNDDLKLEKNIIYSQYIYKTLDNNFEEVCIALI